MIGTRQEVGLHLAELQKRDEGWTFLPVDDPRSGLKGFVAYRTLEDGSEESRTYQWPITGDILFPETRQVELTELIDFIEKTGTQNLILCDDPVRRMIGFGRYEPERHVVVVVEIPLTKVVKAEGLSHEQRAAFLKMREGLQEAQKKNQVTIYDLIQEATAE